ncbi:DUF6600 domain-containing protein [Cyclobacterium plantarum]|uniref:DUF6600 domain-containing protein n=1 Tax=Cyclobacterium plantarum TaxID=2716263 RepID=UPI003F728463
MKNSISNRSQMVKVASMFIFGLFFLFTGKVNEIKASPFAVSFQVFYDELSPYGDWVEDPHYGFIWIPYAEQGFQPYRTNGHWVMSSYGNTWVSTYDWGWAPFHYGRWFFSDMYGWAWIPGYEWGPAWVNWRSGSGYYGWFPLGPRVQFYASVRFPVYSHWVFVPRRRVLSRNIYRYYLPGRNVNVIYNQTNIINNTYVYNNQTYITGPSRSELRRVTRRDVPVYQVREGRRPGRSSINNNNLELYKPEIRRTNTQARGDVNLRPRSYTSSRDYKPSDANQVRTERRAMVPGTNTRSTIRTEALKNRGEASSRADTRNGINTRNNNLRSSSAMEQPNNIRQRSYNPATETNVRRSQPAPSNTRRQVQPRVRTPQNQADVRVAPRERTVRPNTTNVNSRQRNTTHSNQRVNPGNSRQQVRRSAPSNTINRPSTQRQRSQQVQSPTRRSNPTVNRSSTRVAPKAQPSQRARSSSAPSTSSRSRRGN